MCAFGAHSPKLSQVSESKYVPRDYAVDPKMFGRGDNRVRWREDLTAPEDLDRLQASKAQHRSAMRMRGHIKVFGSVQTFAAEHGLNYARLSRLLRGEIVMTLLDMATAERLLPNVFKRF